MFGRPPSSPLFPTTPLFRSLPRRHGINGIREKAVRNHGPVVGLFNRSVERVLNHLAGEGGPATAGILRVGEVLGPGKSAAEREVLAISLLSGQLQSMISVRAAGVSPDGLVEALIGAPAGGERSRGG